jgi:type VI secretion system protein ImpJ
MVYLLVLISLNRYASYFKQLQDKIPAHPHDVYQVIGQLVGELSSFSEHVNSLGVLEQEYPEKPKAKDRSISGDGQDKEIRSLMAYNHDDLWTCFFLAQKLISRLVEEITTGPDHVLEIVFTDPYYTCAMDEELFKGDCSYYLVMRTATELKDVVNNIDIGIKVTSPELMRSIVERSLPGALVEYLPVPPQELPRRTNGIYFKIDTKSESFNSIRKEKQLALFWYEPPEDLKMELMVVKEK